MASSITKKKHHTKNVVSATLQIAKLLFIPHHANNYRPHIVRHYGIAIVLVSVIALQLGYGLITTGDVLGQQTNITANSLLIQTNKTRTASNEAPLRLNTKLNQAAYLKAQDMLTDQYWDHNAPDGTEPWYWFGQVGYNYSEAGENLAKNFTTTDAVMTAWLNSPEHKANILNGNYMEAGFAIVSGDLEGKPASIVVALYGMPANNVLSESDGVFNQANVKGDSDISTRLGVAINSVTPPLIVGLILIVVTIFVALASHSRRNKLPKIIQKSWRKHHGLYKSLGLTLFALILLFISSGGQI